MTWLSPSFPIGGYAYSHSIEFAVEDNRVTNEKELCVWIESILRFGAGRIDGALLCFTWRAIIESNYEQLRWAVNKGNVMRSSFEMGLEIQQGKYSKYQKELMHFESHQVHRLFLAQ